MFNQLNKTQNVCVRNFVIFLGSTIYQEWIQSKDDGDTLPKTNDSSRTSLFEVSIPGSGGCHGNIAFEQRGHFENTFFDMLFIYMKSKLHQMYQNLIIHEF